MRPNKLIGAEYMPVTPEGLRVLHLAVRRENLRLSRLEAARRALALANKLKNAAEKKRHQSRIFSNMNRLRVMA